MGVLLFKGSTGWIWKIFYFIKFQVFIHWNTKVMLIHNLNIYQMSGMFGTEMLILRDKNNFYSFTSIKSIIILFFYHIYSWRKFPCSTVLWIMLICLSDFLVVLCLFVKLNWCSKLRVYIYIHIHIVTRNGLI